MESKFLTDSHESTSLAYDLTQGTTGNSSVNPPTSWDPSQVVDYVLCCIFATSFVGNLSFLISLLASRQSRRRTVNVFICNQTILDIVATLLVATKLSLKMSGYLMTKTGTVRMLVCLIVESDSLSSSAIYGSVYGLVIITLERYAKIVHPIVHRNRYRRWMTYVGVATPWVIGLLTSSIPSLTTTEFVSGTCKVLVFPTKESACVARVALFSWRFIVPLAVFAFCYWKIIVALRRGPVVGTSHPGQPAAGPSTSHAPAATASTGGNSKPLSKSQKNVIKTMIIVVSCFIICWLPFQLWTVFVVCDPNTHISLPLYYLFMTFAVFNLCADPFIYASGQYQFLRAQCIDRLRTLICRENRVGDVNVSQTETASKRSGISTVNKVTTTL